LHKHFFSSYYLSSYCLYLYQNISTYLHKITLANINSTIALLKQIMQELYLQQRAFKVYQSSKKILSL